MKTIDCIDYYHIDKGIQQLKNISFNHYPNQHIIFHVYWYGNITRKQLLPIKSYLATQNLNNTTLWIWLDVDNGYNQDNINLIPNHNNIIIKKYDPKIESSNTLLYNHPAIYEKKFIKFRSDLARLIVLYKYGGLYYDLDLILLKNLDCILDLEFCYQWSILDKGNNAILRLKKNSPNSIQLINKYIQTLKTKNFTISFNQTIFTSEINITCFPSVMFDPCWIIYDTKTKSKYSYLTNFDDFFLSTNEDISTFFDNQIFAYHWHSRNKYTIQPNSYFERFETYIQDKIKKKT